MSRDWGNRRMDIAMLEQMEPYTCNRNAISDMKLLEALPELVDKKAFEVQGKKVIEVDDLMQILEGGYENGGEKDVCQDGD